MNDLRLERLLDDVLADIAAEHVPDRLGPDISSSTSRIRQRPRWLALLKEPPMRLPSGVPVGSPTFRLACVMALTFALVLVAAGAVAVGASLVPTMLPEPSPVVEPSPMASPGTSPGPSPATAADTPLAVTVGDSGFYHMHGSAYAAVLLSNPNPSRWVANDVSVVIEFLDKDGALLVTDEAHVALLPGQTSAAVTQTPVPDDTSKLRVSVSGDATAWEDIGDQTPGTLTFSDVRTRTQDALTNTTGDVHSSFDAPLERFSVIAVYRDGRDRIIGYTEDSVDSLSAGGTMPFRTDSVFLRGDCGGCGQQHPETATTEMYFQP
jgi:hypothetical protein